MNSTTENKSVELYRKYMEAQRQAYELLEEWRKAQEKEKSKHRQVIAHYDVISTFEIPEGIDLEGDEVENWYVKYNTLYIIFTDPNREKLEIEARMSATDDDLKRPEHTYIVNDDERE